MTKEDYQYILVESFIPDDLNGKHGEIHIRPLPNQEPYKREYMVECNKALSYDHPLGTQFRIKAKITNREGGKTFIYSHYTWPYEVLK